MIRASIIIIIDSTRMIAWIILSHRVPSGTV